MRAGAARNARDSRGFVRIRAELTGLAQNSKDSCGIQKSYGILEHRTKLKGFARNQEVLDGISRIRTEFEKGSRA